MSNEQQAVKTPAWKSPWVIGWVALVLVVLGVNITMVYLAMRTSPGLVVEDYYERGQDYEKNMFSKRAQDPGWHMTIDVPKQLFAGNHIPVNFSIVDKAGVPVQPDSVTFYAYRPSDAERDFSMPMEQQAKGLYSGKPQFVLKGVWDILVSARVGDQEYNVGQRIEVAAPN
jgi:nitrogen fixation protein FixH